MMLPDQEDTAPVETDAIQQQEQTLEKMLEEILCQIEGAGKVEVLLTEHNGQEIQYQTDDESERNSESSHQRADTVLVEGSERQDSGLIRRIDSPVYRGALIVCQGADHPQVRLAIVEAVCCVTGLGADQISVVKMK
jgi:stage III sporulation protein AG